MAKAKVYSASDSMVYLGLARAGDPIPETAKAGRTIADVVKAGRAAPVVHAKPKTGATVADVIRAARDKANASKATSAVQRLGRAMRGTGVVDGAKMAELQSHHKQVIPNRDQCIEFGGGVGGYIRALRSLND